MKRSYATLFCAVALMALAATAYAESKVTDVPEGPTSQTGPNCDLTGYKSEVQVPSPPTAVPDNNAAGVVLGPIVTPADGSIIVDVIIDLRMSHTWIGDMNMTVGYDVGCNGTIDAQSVIMCRPSRSTCTGAGSPFGCSGDFSCNNELRFSDAALAPFATPTTCPTLVASGCYKPTGVGATPLAVFNGMIKNGCWYLLAVDQAGGDLGTICQWSVHLLNEHPVPALAKSWGAVKSIYR